ncbi:MAG TPA: response regulator [Steroidobacteraceae bacterium]|nr:response regulator [Steroidobacteraceae bacterium]
MAIDDRVNILLVDDQPARLLTYQSILSELGQNLVLAHSGREALDKLMHDEFAVVLLDVNMPDMDGFETAELIHAHPRFEKTPIIFVTGIHVSELDRLRGYKAGAVDYVAIPVVPEILRSKVAVLVELYCKRHELRQLNRILANANRQLSEANLTLQAERTRELESFNATLQRANTELEETNRSLQKEVGERARAERALQEADRNKDEFLAMLAHELRNPLAPIRNALQLMRMNPSQPRLQWAQEVIHRQLVSLTRLVDDLLDVSRITRGKITLTRQALDIATLINRAVETIEPLVLEREHQLTLRIPPDPMRVDGDPTRLTQALANVLGNAAKYTERGGRIELTCTRQGAEVELRVRDNGIGIPAELLPRIFDLFTQLDRRSDQALSGLGIGLALVRRLLEMHGGSISALSEGAGTGSEFVIRLPLLADSAVRTESDNDPQHADVPAVPRRILLADDNADALESLATVLRLRGHEVFSASNGAIALETAGRHVPEVALLDIGMPLLDGYEVARRIRAQEWGKGMTLVALTGWGQDADRRRSREAGFDTHLVKPLDLDQLSDLLAQLPEPVTATAPAAATA